MSKETTMGTPKSAAIDALAKLFSGPSVVHNSIGLSIGGIHEKVGREFFDVRSKLGVNGYDTEETARAAITRILGP